VVRGFDHFDRHRAEGFEILEQRGDRGRSNGIYAKLLAHVLRGTGFQFLEVVCLRYNSPAESSKAHQKNGGSSVHSIHQISTAPAANQARNHFRKKSL
jgi:hypothetical protein